MPGPVTIGMLRFDLKGAKKLLFLGAHSDDIEIGCGGTILALTEAYSGLNILWAVLSAKGKRRRGGAIERGIVP